MCYHLNLVNKYKDLQLPKLKLALKGEPIGEASSSVYAKPKVHFLAE